MSQPGKSATFVVVPEFVVKPDCLDAFLALAKDDASHSVADEPGCRQFDIVQMERAPCQVLVWGFLCQGVGLGGEAFLRRFLGSISKPVSPSRPAHR